MASISREQYFVCVFVSLDGEAFGYAGKFMDNK